MKKIVFKEDTEPSLALFRGLWDYVTEAEIMPALGDKEPVTQEELDAWSERVNAFLVRYKNIKEGKEDNQGPGDKTPPSIKSKKVAGSQIFIDMENGDRWEIMPEINSITNQGLSGYMVKGFDNNKGPIGVFFFGDLNDAVLYATQGNYFSFPDDRKSETSALPTNDILGNWIINNHDVYNNIRRSETASKTNKVRKQIIMKGGPTSGNHGHSGRPGLVGGSAPSEERSVSNPELISKLKSSPYATSPKSGNYNKGAFESEIVHVDGDGDAIKKFNTSSDKTWNISEGFAQREATAFDVDQLLELGIVPPTVLRDENGEVISLQEWMTGAHMLEYEIEEYQHPERARFLAEHPGKLENLLDVQHTPAEDYGKLALLDGIMGNHDRHSGNILFQNHQIWAIDNGLSLEWSSNLPDGFMEYARKYFDYYCPEYKSNMGDYLQLSDSYKDKLKEVIDNGKLKETLSHAIPTGAEQNQQRYVNAAVERAQYFVDNWDDYFRSDLSNMSKITGTAASVALWPPDSKPRSTHLASDIINHVNEVNQRFIDNFKPDSDMPKSWPKVSSTAKKRELSRVLRLVLGSKYKPKSTHTTSKRLDDFITEKSSGEE